MTKKYAILSLLSLLLVGCNNNTTPLNFESYSKYEINYYKEHTNNFENFLIEDNNLKTKIKTLYDTIINCNSLEYQNETLIGDPYFFYSINLYVNNVSYNQIFINIAEMDVTKFDIGPLQCIYNNKNEAGLFILRNPSYEIITMYEEVHSEIIKLCNINNSHITNK